MELDTLDSEYEHILFKSLLNDSDVFGKVMPILKEQYFLIQGVKILFSVLKRHYENYQKIPNLTELVGYIREIPHEESKMVVISSLKSINAIPDVPSTDYMIDSSVKFVKDAIYTEALIIGSDGLSEKSETKKLKAQELMEEMLKVSVDSELGLSFKSIKEQIEYYQNKLYGILSGHVELNKRLGSGFLPGTLSIIAAPSGVGKTLLMNDLISTMLLPNKVPGVTGEVNGKNILLVSMEMSENEMMKRIHANVLDIPIYDLNKIPAEAIMEKYNSNTNGAGQFYVKEYPNGAFSAMMLEQLLDSYKIEKNIEFDIVFLDYLGIMKSDRTTPMAGLYSYVKSIVEEVRAVAVKRQIPILSASQLNRSATSNTDAGNDAVSDSMGAVMTADYIMFLLQTEEMKEENIITCKVTKNRFTGRTDKWDMQVDYTKMRFKDLLVQSAGGMTETQVGTALEQIKQTDDFLVKKHDNNLSGDFTDSTIAPIDSGLYDFLDDV